MQKRLDISIAKSTKINERLSFELGFDLFNIFDTVNFANPNSDLQDSVDFGVITNTVGGPRVGQFRASFAFNTTANARSNLTRPSEMAALFHERQETISSALQP